MTPELIATIQTFTLNSRKLLERETEEQLQGLYGWLPDGSFGVGTALALTEAAETRKQLEAYVAEEAEAGVDAAAARAKLKRETAFTWLNRAVALRLMEERSIIRSTFAKLHKSNAFIYWLTEVKGETSIPPAMPINAMAEGPVDAAYREFLLWQCGELAAEVSVLFDPITLASRLCPRPAVLKKLAEMMNVAGITDAWKAGNEETIGWVYQGFNAEELQAAFAAAKANKKKFEPEDIPAVTQLFTISWVVRFLVENTLGRIWVEMHPDSRFAQSLGYFAPPKHPQPRALRPVKDITFLDPCCGSMHFGLLAFDLFAEMYREERENAGKPGWPDSPSAATEEEIPELILAHNLHGIDIDTRAVQLSALTLVLKARMLNPKARVTDTNLASANIEQITGGQLDEFISKSQFSHPIYERILRRIAERVKDSPHLGSLLRLEKDIQQLVETELKKAEADQQFMMDFPGMNPEQFKTKEGFEEFFDVLTDQILRHLDHFVKSTRAEGQHAGLFAREAAKGLRFLNLIDQRYDVVTTNPPYLSGRKMNQRLATLMEQEYKEGKGDLYAAFIMRCQELLAPEGLMGMLTMHSFMFISSYEDLRTRLRKEVAIETLAHFGGGLFAVGNPGTLQTAAFVLRREPDAAKRENQVGTYFRLVKERDADAKRLAFESALAALRQGDDHHQLFHYQQSDFDLLATSPLAYWISSSIRHHLQSLPIARSAGTSVVGCFTCDNKRFVRFWWEVGVRILDRPEQKWVPYMKMAGGTVWASPEEEVVNYESRGAEIRERRILTGQSFSLPGEDYYFREAVTFPHVSSKGFSAWITGSDFIYDTASMPFYPNSVYGFLGVFNSRPFKFLLACFNPTINVQAHDVGRVPVPASLGDGLEKMVEHVVKTKSDTNSLHERSRNFTTPPINRSILSAASVMIEASSKAIDAEVARLYGLSEEDLAVIDRELNGSGNSDSDDDAEDDTESADDDTGDLIPADWARSWISYALGTVLGRFEIGQPGGLGCGDFPEATVAEIRKLIDPDGIMPCDAGHPQDIAARAFACLELMLGAAEAHAAIRSATDTEGDAVDALRGWLARFTGTPDRSFWKYHHQLYRKRPVYWPFQSPKKTFTLWVFHEKLGPNTLHTLRDLVTERLNLLEREITDLRPAAAINRAKAKELDKLIDVGDDLREFSARIKTHIDAGYESCIDDGVLLNAAPLHDLFPSWPDTAAAWKELEKEKYEWAHQAMRHWPDRVTEACRSNRSFAIAHNLEHLCPAPPPKRAKKATKKATTPKNVPETGTLPL